ncbi:MAG TPA: ABC transporter permease [Acidobacteriota bacterium]|nr:ABC transporter permease [Acidobacteriota bacterium]
MLETILGDFGYVLRSLRRNGGYASAITVSLALGIGVNAAIFSLLDAVLLRPFPVRSPEQLVALYTTPVSGGWSSTSYPDYIDYRAQTGIFAGLMGYIRSPFSFYSGGRTERLGAEMVSWNYFLVLGVRLPLGRSFQQSDESAADSVILSYALWQRNFGSDPNVLGRSVRINGNAFTVIGVAPRGFRGVTLDWGLLPDLWVPITVMDQQRISWWHREPLLRLRDARMQLVVGRLQPGVKIEQAEAAVRLKASQLASAYPKTNRGFTARLLPPNQARFWPSYRATIVLYLGLLTTVSGLVLLLACVNAATLVLSRSMSREHETAIRLALGAGPAALMRQQLIESVVLSTSGLALGLAMASGLLILFRRFPLPFEVGLTLDIGLDWRVLLNTVGVAGTTTLILGLVPMLQASRFDLRSALQSRHSARHAGNRWRGTLVAVEVALSAILLVGAGLFVRELRQTRMINLGFNPDRVMVLSVDFNSMDYRYDDAKGQVFYHRVLEQISGLPGVRSATWGGDVPLALRRLIIYFAWNGQTPALESDWIRTECNIVGPHYLETLGIPLVRGRDFSKRDDESSPGAVIVNETMARRYWPSEDPIGKWVRLRGRPREMYQIVGVARDVHQHAFWEAPAPYLYIPLYQRYFPEMILHVRTVDDSMAALPPIRREIEAIDNDLPVFDEGSLRSQVDRALAQPRMAAALLSAAGGLSLILAVLGVYGIMNYWVLQRRHEIGIRMSLGAGRGSILALVLRQGLVLAGCGLSVGVGACLLLTRFVRELLHVISPKDPFILVGCSVLLVLVSLLACVIPSRRAARMDPMAVLRQE